MSIDNAVGNFEKVLDSFQFFAEDFQKCPNCNNEVSIFNFQNCPYCQYNFETFYKLKRGDKFE